MVLLGQAAGFTVLCALSLLGLVLGLFIPAGYVGIIGFMPVLMGLFKLYELVKDKCAPHRGDQIEVAQAGAGAADRGNAQPGTGLRWATAAPAAIAGDSSPAADAASLPGVVGEVVVFHFSPDSDAAADLATVSAFASSETTAHASSDGSAAAGNGVLSTTAAAPTATATVAAVGPSHGEGKSDVEQTDSGGVAEGEGAEEPPCLARAARSCCRSRLNPHALKVAVMTVANGGDNISIYLPLFATASAGGVVETLVVFYLLLLLWCLTSFLMVRCSFVARALSSYGVYVVPFLLIALGLYVLRGSVVFNGTG